MSKDQSLYKKSVSKKYYRDQKKLGFIKKVFTGKKVLAKSVEFDIKIKKGATEDGYYFINIKEKTKKSYSKNWFSVEKNSNKKYQITGMHHFDS